MSLGWIPLHSHNHLNYVERPKCPYLNMSGYPSILLLVRFGPNVIYFIIDYNFCQTRKIKAEKAKLGACDEGILIFESTKSIIMNHNVDERCPFATREAFSCFLLVSHEWFSIQCNIKRELKLNLTTVEKAHLIEWLPSPFLRINFL